MHISRRALMSAGPVAALLAGCQITGGNGAPTQATLDVAKIDAYAQAFGNLGASFLANPLIVAALGPTIVLAAQGTIVAIQQAAAAFDQATGGALTVTFDNTNAVSAAKSILADAQQLLGQVQPVVSKVAGDAATALNTTLASLQSLVALLQAMLTVGTASAPLTPMTEANALAVAHVSLKR